jgi:branched-chain amino acid transport system substrate-binding protein
MTHTNATTRPSLFHGRPRRMWSRFGVVAVAAMCAVALAACGSSESSNSTSSTGPASISASGPVAEAGYVPTPSGKATGSPYVIASIDDTLPGESVFAQHLAGEKAAIAYINEELGGVNGHPLKLYQCNTGGVAVAPATATCARSAVAQQPIIVTGTAIAFGSAGAPIIAAAGIATETLQYVAQDFANPDAFPTGAAATSEAQAEGAYAKQAFNPKTVTVLSAEGVNAADALKLTQKGLGSGVKAKLVTFPLTGASTLASVVQAVGPKPDVLVVNVGAGPLAVSLLKQIQQQGYPSSRIVAVMAAVDGETLDDLGSSIEGAKFMFEFKPWTLTSDPQVATYLKAYKKYGNPKVTAQSGFTEWGFSDVMQAWKTANQVKGTVTGPKLLKYLKSAKTVPGFLNHGLGAPSPGYPGVRNPYIYLVKAEKGTLKPVNGQWFVSPALLP